MLIITLIRSEKTHSKSAYPVQYLVTNSSKTHQSIAKTIHCFLLEVFCGYTCASGNIYGYFKSTNDEYDELREFRVAFKEDDFGTKVPKLQKFLADICSDIGEECIYLECGEDAMLIYP